MTSAWNGNGWWVTAGVAAIALALHGSPAAAQPAATAGPITIEAPWSRATPAGAKVAGGYLRLTNTGSATDRLVGGSLETAGRVELHEMSVDGAGVMRMRQLPRGLELKPGETVELKPGGLHVMFVDLRETVREGRPLRGTLTFEKAGTVAVEYAVRPLGAPTAGHSHH